MKRLILLCLLTLTLTGVATAKDSFDLVYKKQNRWVATEDAKGLRALLKTAKQQNVTNFFVQMPKEDRAVNIERLIVLRDILQKQLKKAVTIEEVEGATKANLIQVHFK